MTRLLIGFLTGCIVGGLFGVFLACILVAARRADDAIEAAREPEEPPGPLRLLKVERNGS